VGLPITTPFLPTSWHHPTVAIRTAAGSINRLLAIDYFALRWDR
jgi:hypothetical protein